MAGCHDPSNGASAHSCLQNWMLWLDDNGLAANRKPRDVIVGVVDLVSSQTLIAR